MVAIYDLFALQMQQISTTTMSKQKTSQPSDSDDPPAKRTKFDLDESGFEEAVSVSATFLIKFANGILGCSSLSNLFYYSAHTGIATNNDAASHLLSLEGKQAEKTSFVTTNYVSAKEYSKPDFGLHCYKWEAGLTKENSVLITDDDDDTIPYTIVQSDYEDSFSGNGDKTESDSASNHLDEKGEWSKEETNPLAEDDNPTQSEYEDGSCSYNYETSEYSISEDRTWDQSAPEISDSDSDSDSDSESDSESDSDSDSDSDSETLTSDSVTSSCQSDPLDIKMPQYSDDGDEFVEEYD